ncbi:MAG: addiction module protein [Fimbriiglobus sp.]
MTQTLKELGIDRMTPAERIALALEIWASLDAGHSAGHLSPDQIADLANRDKELDANPGIAVSWDEMMASLDAPEPSP